MFVVTDRYAAPQGWSCSDILSRNRRVLFYVFTVTYKSVLSEATNSLKHQERKTIYNDIPNVMRKRADFKTIYLVYIMKRDRTSPPAILIEAIRGFSQSLQANVVIVPEIRPMPLATKSFPIHHSLPLYNQRYIT
jgi:hypothetical protein